MNADPSTPAGKALINLRIATTWVTEKAIPVSDVEAIEAACEALVIAARRSAVPDAKTTKAKG